MRPGTPASPMQPFVPSSLVETSVVSVKTLLLHVTCLSTFAEQVKLIVVKLNPKLVGPNVLVPVWWNGAASTTFVCTPASSLTSVAGSLTELKVKLMVHWLNAFGRTIWVEGVKVKVPFGSGPATVAVPVQIAPSVPPP